MICFVVDKSFLGLELLFDIILVLSWIKLGVEIKVLRFDVEHWDWDLLCFLGRLTQYFIKSVCFRFIIFGGISSMISWISYIRSNLLHSRTRFRPNSIFLNLWGLWRGTFLFLKVLMILLDIDVHLRSESTLNVWYSFMSRLNHIVFDEGSSRAWASP